MDPTRLPRAPYPLAHNSQTACYRPWLKVRVLIRAARTCQIFMRQGGPLARTPG